MKGIIILISITFSINFFYSQNKGNCVEIDTSILETLKVKEKMYPFGYERQVEKQIFNKYSSLDSFVQKTEYMRKYQIYLDSSGYIDSIVPSHLSRTPFTEVDKIVIDSFMNYKKINWQNKYFTKSNELVYLLEYSIIIYIDKNKKIKIDW
jgi:hypothetical protein